jgi:hypothetical protein
VAGADGRRRLALDANFPEPILAALDVFIVDIELIPLLKIDPQLRDLDDRPLILALRQEGFDWLVTNNYRMLRNPSELAAIIKARINVFAIEGTGHDPLRATGALLLDLPGAVRRASGKGEVFWSRPRNPHPEEAMGSVHGGRHAPPSKSRRPLRRGQGVRRRVACAVA